MKATIQTCYRGAILLLFGFFMACDGDDPEPDPIAEMRTNIKTGSWRVSYFFDETDETHLFTGYTFVFNDDKTVRATKGTVAVSGMWELLWASNSEKLVLDFAVIEPFDELNDDWDILEVTESKIVLEDVSGGNGEIDYLTLEKIQ